MHTLQRHPDEAPPDAHTEELRREVLEGPPSLDSWNLVENRWNLGSVLVLLAGALSAVVRPVLELTDPDRGLANGARTPRPPATVSRSIRNIDPAAP